MPQFDEKHIKVCGCTIIWDAMTRPDTNESGTKHNFKVVVPPNNPDIPLLEALAARALQEGVFKGVLPNGGTLPVGTLGPNEYGGQFNGWRIFTSGTYRGVPDIYDENGQKLDIMQAGALIYPGQKVDLLVHCYENNGKVKGIACGLDGFAIIASANAPRQNFGNNASLDTSGAFGAGSGQPVQQQTATTNTAQRFDPNTGQPIAQEAAPVRYDPNTGQPIAQEAAPVKYDPNTGQPIQPQQAHDFLPPQ